MRGTICRPMIVLVLALLNPFGQTSVKAQEPQVEIPPKAVVAWKKLESELESAPRCLQIKNVSRETGEIYIVATICQRDNFFLVETMYSKLGKSFRFINGPTHNIKLHQSPEGVWRRRIVTTREEALPDDEQNQIEIFKALLTCPYKIGTTRFDTFFDVCRITSVKENAFPEHPSWVRVDYELDAFTRGSPFPEAGDLAGWIGFDPENDWRRVSSRLVFRDLPSPDNDGEYQSRYEEVEYLDGYLKMARNEDNKPLRPGSGGSYEMEQVEPIELEEFNPGFYGIKVSSPPGSDNDR